MMDRKWLTLRRWIFCLIITVFAIAICIRWLDVPVAFAFQGHASRYRWLGRDLSSSILVTGELALIVALAIVRIIRGKLPENARAVFIACCSSLSAFETNDYILKVFFGRQTPTAFFHKPTIHIFYFLRGDEHNSFPSGHMVMASTFAAVIIRLYPRTAPLLSGLLCFGAFTLLIGDWHFVSDILAGVFFGGTAGLMAAELWGRNTGHYAPE